MGTITHLNERQRTAPIRITTEEEALAVSKDLAISLAGVQNGALSEALSRSGLLAVSIPSDFGGADVSNVVLSQIVAVLAQHTPLAASMLTLHLSSLELLRNGGTEEQRRAAFARAAAGERFCFVQSSEVLQLLPDGIGYALSGEVECLCVPQAEWLVINRRSPTDDTALLIPASPGRAIERSSNAGPARILFDSEHVHSDSVLALGRDAVRLSAALNRLLLASITLGETERSIAEFSQQQQWNRESVIVDADRESAIGQLLVQTTTLSALTHTCGTAFDIAQVNPAAQTIGEACRQASILEFVATRGTVGDRQTEALDEILAIGRSYLADRSGRSV